VRVLGQRKLCGQYLYDMSDLCRVVLGYKFPYKPGRRVGKSILMIHSKMMARLQDFLYVIDTVWTLGY